MSIPINYIFLRHGQSLNNSINDMFQNNIITKQDIDILSSNNGPLIDPVLSPIGKYSTVLNGAVASGVLQRDFNITTINMVGCSPLLRSMLSAYYSTRKWQSPPKVITVLPYLREIDESSNNKWSGKSKIIMNTTPGYMMKDILYQKRVLNQWGILSFFDFNLIEQYITARSEPGDINNFINWSSKIFVKKFNKPFNFYIITHSGVLRDYLQRNYSNNDGIIIKYMYQPNNNRYYLVKKTPLYLDREKKFISDYSSKYSVQTNRYAFETLKKGIV
jgi:hypothetical protein